MGAMKTKTIALTLAISFLAGAVCFAAADPQMGTWKLNEAKSKVTSGMGKITMVVYKPIGGQVDATVDGIDEKGKPTHNEWKGKFDGKDYPVTGDPTSDTRSYIPAGESKLEMTVKKDGKVTVTGTIVVSADRKSRTVITSGTDDKGAKIVNTAVYD